MNHTRHFSRLTAPILAISLSGTAPALLVAQPLMPYQGGPVMMGGYGGGYGMGPGMMGGYSIGPGMMGGYGMGPGMMGGYWGNGLGLTQAQQAELNKIQDETRKVHWALMSEMMDQQAKLRDLNLAPQRDNAAIDEAYKTFGKLQQRMYDTKVEAHNRMRAVLTKEQQEK